MHGITSVRPEQLKTLKYEEILEMYFLVVNATTFLRLDVRARPGRTREPKDPAVDPPQQKGGGGSAPRGEGGGSCILRGRKVSPQGGGGRELSWRAQGGGGNFYEGGVATALL